jgi:glycosyltransferase involved in cell wall biosynthesis
LPAFEQIENVTFYRFFTDFDARLLKLTQHIRGKVPDFASRFYHLLYLLRAAFMLRKLRCDIIHIFNLSQFVPLARRLNPRATIVLNMHCDWLASMDYSRLNKRLRAADWIFGCANCITDQIRSRFPHYAERCKTIQNGVDVDTFHPSPGEPAPTPIQTIITVGRISPEKGLHVLLDALEIVLGQTTSVRLRIIGAESVLSPQAITNPDTDSNLHEILGSYQDNYLRNLQKRLRGVLGTNVSLVGALPHAQIASEMRAATLLVQPSLYDLAPLPVLESMITGLPVVASKVGGLAEIVVNGETGLLVEPGNSLQLAEALSTLLSDRRRARAMGVAGRKRALDLFSWETVVGTLESYYESKEKK